MLPFTYRPRIDDRAGVCHYLLVMKLRHCVLSLAPRPSKLQSRKQEMVDAITGQRPSDDASIKVVALELRDARRG